MQVKDITQILESIGKDILTEEVRKDIAKLFAEAVDATVTERVQMVVDNELSKLDEDHTAKLEALVESIDEDHTAKMKSIVEAIDADYTNKLRLVSEKYEKELSEGAKALREELIGKVSNYLSLYLEECVPAKDLTEAVANTRARSIVEQVRTLVGIGPEHVDQTVREAVLDGRKTIDALKGKVDELMRENMEVRGKFGKLQSDILLEGKTKDLPESKRKYVRRLLEGKSVADIEKNFKFVVEMFERDEGERIASATSTAMGKSQTLTEKVDTPKTVVSESVEDGDSDALMSAYLDGLKGRKG